MVKLQTKSAAIYSELGKVLLSFKRKGRMLKYWFKIKNSSDIDLSNAYYTSFIYWILILVHLELENCVCKTQVMPPCP